MSTDSDLRQRTITKEAVSNGKATPAQKEEHREKKKAEAQKAGMTLIEGIRVLVALSIIGLISSYLITRGDSWIFGLKRPWWTKPNLIQAALKPQLQLTQEELATYDGSDPSKPILLALNRTIYDVSASPHVYGPQGPYHKLVAKDASRSYVTTCFDPEQDLVPYLGGVEEVFVPLWLSNKPTQKELDKIAKGEIMDGMGLTGVIDQIQRNIGRKKSRLMREDAYRLAQEKVRDKIKVWEGMFEKKEYPIVGKVVGIDDADESKWKDLKFCDEALAQRPPLADSLSNVMKAAGRKDGKIDLGMMKKKQKGKQVPQFDPNNDIRNNPDKRKADMANAKRDDMRDEGKYGSVGKKKEEDAARAAERKRRREERKAEIAARKGIKASEVSDEVADALADTVVDE